MGVSPSSRDAVGLREPEFTVSRRAMAWWAIRSLLAWGSMLAMLIVAAVVWPAARVWLWAPIVAIGVVLIATAAIQPWWRYRVHRWEVSGEATYARGGWWSSGASRRPRGSRPWTLCADRWSN